MPSAPGNWQRVINGNITLSGDARLGGGNGGATGYSGVISGPFALDLGAIQTINSNFTLYNSGDSWTGTTTIVGRTGNTAGANIIHNGANDVIPNGFGKGNVVMNAQTNGGSITWDLGGFNEQINGLSSSGTAGNQFINNAVANTTSTLTVGDNDQAASFAGIIQNGSGTVALTKVGNGLQTLAGANTYTGPTNVNGGILAITGSLSGTGVVNVNTSATSSGALAGASSSSLGTVTLAAATGAHKAFINPGPGGPGSVGTITMQRLTVGAGSDLQFDLVTPGSSDGIQVNGPAAFNGAFTITPSGVPTAGTYTLINASGGFSGTAPTLVSGGDTRLVFNLDPNSWNPTTNASATSISVDISGSAANLTWTGLGDGSTWDLHTTQNWNSTAAANPKLFFNGDSVTFDDTGAPNYAVSLGGTVTPGNITVNASGNYLFGGGGSIIGPASLTKNGTGALTLATGNSFSGGTTINGGTLVVNNNTALGTGSLILNVGVLDNNSGNNVVVSGVPQVMWNSDITFGGGGNDLDMSVATVSFGSIANGANRTVTVNANTFSVGSITDNGNNNGLIKAGVGTLVMAGNNSFGGPVSINAGTLKVNTFGGLGTNTTTGTTIAAGAALDIGGIATTNAANGFGSMPFTISGNGPDGSGAIINSSAGIAQQNAFQSITLAADASVGGTGRMDIRGGTPVLNINGHTLTKVGPAQFSVVSGTVSAGNIVVNGGTFSIEAAATVVDNADGTSITANPGTGIQFFENTGTVTRPIIMNGAGFFDNSAAGSSSIIGSNVTMLGNATFGSANAATLTMNGQIIQSGGTFGLIKTGPGTLVLNNASNSYTGGNTINGGSVTYVATSALGSGSLVFGGGALAYPSGNTDDVSALGITLNTGGGTIDTNNNSITLAHNIVGSGSLNIRGNATVTLSGVNTYGGATTVQNGTVILGSASALPSGLPLGFSNSATNDSATLDLGGNSITVSALNNIGTGGANITNNGVSAAPVTITYAGTGNNTFSGNIQNGTSAISLNITSGNLTLTNNSNNNYTGTTTVAAGASLTMNGNHSNGGVYTVNGGIGGTGNIGSAVNVAAGGTLSPGAASALGNFHVSALSLAGRMNIRVNDGDQNHNDVMNVDNLLSLSSGSSLSLTVTGFHTQLSYVFAHYGSLSGNPFTTVTGLPAGSSIDYNYQGGNQIALVTGGLLLGDFSLNNIVNTGTDASGNDDIQGMFLAILNPTAWKAAHSASDATLKTVGDFNGDGVVDNKDIPLFINDLLTVNGNTVPDNFPGNIDLNAHALEIPYIRGNGVVDNIAAGPASIQVDGAQGSQTFGGTIQNTGGPVSLIVNGAGTLTLNGVNTYTGGTTINAGASVIVTSNGGLPLNGAIVNNGSLNVTSNNTVGRITGAGTLAVGSTNFLSLATGSGGSTMASLTIAGGGTLDINNNHLTVSYGASADPTNTLVAAITSAYHAGAWDQAGLTSSAARTNTAYGIGYKDDTTAHTLLIQYALFGDANLDGTVNALDFNAVATNFGVSTGARWGGGDFNYDGIVNTADFTALATNFGQIATGVAAPALGSLVPEPTSATMLALAAIGLTSRRRRRRG